MVHGASSDAIGAYCIVAAAVRAEPLAVDAVLDETGYQLDELLAGILPGLKWVMIVVGGSTLLGAGIGFLIASVPGVVVGADLGFDIGMACLTWLGIGFLAAYMAFGFGELVASVHKGIGLAWQARNLTRHERSRQIDRAADELARSTGILIRLVLQAILLYLMKGAGMKSARGIIKTVDGLRAEGAVAISEQVVTELVGRLKSSRFGVGLGKWVQENWRSLIRNRKLGGGRGAIKVTEQMIRNVMKDAPLRSQQKGGVSLPLVRISSIAC